MKKRKDGRVERSLFSFKNYLVFFLLISFVVTACFLLFLETLEIEIVNVEKSAIVTFGNVVFLSFLCGFIYSVQRKITVERPVKRILTATDKLTQGDFTTRIKPLNNLSGINEFDVIIDDFNKMAQELSSIETLRTDFIANVSHELKTPLSVIRNYSTMLQSPELPEELRIKYAKSIMTASQNFSELITNILKLSKLENQQIFSESKEFDLSEQIRECLLTFESAWEEKELVIETDITGVNIHADPELLTLIWNNLFSNAIKFTERNGVIQVTVKEEVDYVVVTVSDTGCGMSNEVGKHIFEKFYQGDTSHAERGNGLGLALVKRVVDIVGGTISVNSIVDEGSTFEVKLWKGII